jgi:hypothetical protein
LFNHDDPDCDKVYWNILPWGIAYRQYLTTALRKKFNDLVDRLNDLIKEAAHELEPFGVFYVGGYNDGFMGRGFCEKYEHSCIHSRKHQDKNLETAFWSYKGQDDALTGEGHPAEQICHTTLAVDDQPDPSTEDLQDNPLPTGRVIPTSMKLFLTAENSPIQ